MEHRRGLINIYLLAGFVLLCLFFAWGIARNWSCRSPRPPRVVVLGPYAVKSVESGGGLTVAVRRKRTRQVILESIVAPADGKWAEASRANLEKLAAGTVSVQYERSRLLRELGPEAEQKYADQPIPADEVAAAIENSSGGEKDCSECGGSGITTDQKIVDCPLCGGKGCKDCKDGKIALDWVTIARCQLWMSKHVDRERCPECRAGGECPIASAKIKSIIELRDKVLPQKVTCQMCEGSGRIYVMSRGPLIGVVFGAGGQNLNLEQVKAGLADCRDAAPTEWKAAEKTAKKNKLGMWGKK